MHSRLNKLLRHGIRIGLLSVLSFAVVQAAPVRITSLNLQPSSVVGTNGLSQNYQQRLIQEAADTIKKLNPDVILLQQVRDWETCRELINALKPEDFSIAACSAFRDARTGAAGRGQTAILTRTKAYISWSEAWQAASNSAAPGGFTFAAIRIGDKNLGFFSLQLSDGSSADFETGSDKSHQQAREQAALQIVEKINSLRGWTTNRLQAEVVAGDFNTSTDEQRFAGEKTFSRLEQIGFENALAALPLEQRVTLPGNSRHPNATVDYIFTSQAGLVANQQVSPTALIEHAAVSCVVDLDAPREILQPPVVAGVPPANSQFLSNQTKKWLAGGAVLLLVAAWMLMRMVRVKKVTPVQRGKLSLLPGAGQIVVGPSSESRPVVHIETGSTTVTQSQFQGSSWERPAEILEQAAQHMPEDARKSFMAHLAYWLKSRFVQRLVSDRARLLETQQEATLKVLAVDERLSRVEHQIQQRNREYEQRIDALLKELAEAREENRELIRGKIASLKAEMEKNNQRS